MIASPNDLRRTNEPPDAPYRLHHVLVSAIRELSPTFVLVTFVGPELDTVATTGFDHRIKLILPLPGVGLRPMTMDSDWYAAWVRRPDEMRNPIRTYTIRALRPHLHEMDILIARHGPIGPAGRWLDGLAVGGELVTCLPNARHDGNPGGIDFNPPPGCGRFLIVGDETAAPAIACILEKLPPTATGAALIELPEKADAIIVPRHEGVDVRVLDRIGSRGTALIDATVDAARQLSAGTLVGGQQLEEVDIDADILWDVPASDSATLPAATYAWLAGEAGIIKQLRRHLVSDLGWDRRAVAFMGYWRLGRAEN